MPSRYDVVVVGGGPAGTMAAIAASRHGRRVLILEKNGFLGGTATASMVGPWMAFHAQGRAIVDGLAQELVDRLAAVGGTPGHAPDPLGVCGSITPFDTELTKIILLQMATESGVNLLLHSIATGATLGGDGLVSLSIQNKSGAGSIEGDVFIDASGDADLAVWSGVEVESGRDGDGLPQPMTMMFKVGGVDRERLVRAVEENPSQFVLGVPPGQLRYEKVLAVSGFYDQVQEARSQGRFTVNRDRVLIFSLTREGEFMVNMTRVQGLHAHRGADLSCAEVEGYRQIWEVAQFLKLSIPGFENSFILQTPTQIGIRETRRIRGVYVLHRDDVIEGARFEDSVAVGGFPIDIHAPEGIGVECPQGHGRSYGIPYRCLVTPQVPNLLVAGRCFSATFEAHASARITPTCMAMGQAAGTAAHLSLERVAPVQDVPVRDLRALLLRDRAIIE